MRLADASSNTDRIRLLLGNHCYWLRVPTGSELSVVWLIDWKQVSRATSVVSWRSAQSHFDDESVSADSRNASFDGEAHPDRALSHSRRVFEATASHSSGTNCGVNMLICDPLLDQSFAEYISDRSQKLT